MKIIKKGNPYRKHKCSRCKTIYVYHLLKDRFDDGEIFYDVMDGHFIFCHNGTFYDWSGKINPTNYLVNWNHFDEYDNLQKERIIKDCIL